MELYVLLYVYEDNLLGNLFITSTTFLDKMCCLYDQQASVAVLLTWFNFNPSMDK